LNSWLPSTSRNRWPGISYPNSSPRRASSRPRRHRRRGCWRGPGGGTTGCSAGEIYYPERTMVRRSAPARSQPGRSSPLRWAWSRTSRAVVVIPLPFLVWTRQVAVCCSC
jgi:hypothetical protein